ncbi:hypothetical protein F5884DRAFT_852763 [Xylogone sp. PMI_703]|nr:hypothetical protein F5884DRAFT_852763 [Xylogone sp. PMI_703]
MPTDRAKRIEASCRIIWGDGVYDFDIETDDYITWFGYVKKDFGLDLGPPLTMTGLCNSEDRAWNELERMLGVWARQVQSGEPMTKAQAVEIFAGPNRGNKINIEKIYDLMEQKGIQSAKKT